MILIWLKNQTDLNSESAIIMPSLSQKNQNIVCTDFTYDKCYMHCNYVTCITTFVSISRGK